MLNFQETKSIQTPCTFNKVANYYHQYYYYYKYYYYFTEPATTGMPANRR